MSRPTALLTVGRLPKALDVARALHRAGCRVVLAEPFRLHLARVSNCVDAARRVRAPRVTPDGYLEDLAALAAREGASLVVPVSEETPYVAALSPRLDANTRLFTMPQADVLAVHDKFAFNELAAALGLSVPATALAGTQEAAQLVSEAETVVKPRFSCAGRAVRFLAAGEALPWAPGAAPALVQQRVRGEELSTFTVAHEGRVIGTVVYRGVLRSGTVAVCFEQRFDEPAIAEWVERFVAARRWTGFISFDFIKDAGGRPWALECNPRANSGVHFVEETSLAEALLEPTTTRSLRFHPPGWRQQFYSCLTEAQSRLWRKGFGEWFSAMRRAKDVTFDWRDPWPFWLMTLTASNLLWASWRTGRSLGEVATDDIAWVDYG